MGKRKGRRRSTCCIINLASIDTVHRATLGTLPKHRVELVLAFRSCLELKLKPTTTETLTFIDSGVA